jgi:DNA-binding transcriptional ArsR family regulator
MPYDPAADVFSAIASPARRAILGRLAMSEMPVMEIAESFEMSLPAVSQHLGVLKGAGLVSIRKSGKQRIYSLNPGPLRQVSDWVATQELFWHDKLAALGDYLKENP